MLVLRNTSFFFQSATRIGSHGSTGNANCLFGSDLVFERFTSGLNTTIGPGSIFTSAAFGNFVLVLVKTAGACGVGSGAEWR